jgi:hypothetical protein
MVGALARITLWHIIIVFFSFWMLLADRAPANLAAIVYLLDLEKGSVFAAFSPVLSNKGNAHFSIVTGCNWIVYCACEVALVLRLRFAYLQPVQHLLDLIVILKNCVTGFDIAKKSHVAMFLMPYCGCRSLTWLQRLWRIR